MEKSCSELRGAVQVSSQAELVTDVDEEVFILYSYLKSSTENNVDDFRGLGCVDSRKDTILVTFHLQSSGANAVELDPGEVLPSSSATRSCSKTLRRSRVKKKTKNRSKEDPGITIDIELAQNKTALRSRKGDTGSVLWKASVDFAQLILQQLLCGASDHTTNLFSKSTLSGQHVVELGAGTGLLAITLSPFVRLYTATDMESLVPLLRKNICAGFERWVACPSPSPGSNIDIQALDWLTLQSTLPSRRSRLVSLEPADLVLVVDCIYHPSLLPALVDTIEYLTICDRTAVLVVMELRAVDITREFLNLWLSNSAGWEIKRLNGLLEGPYVMWLGWRKMDEYHPKPDLTTI